MLFLKILVSVFLWSSIIGVIGVFVSASCFHNLPEKIESAILAAITVAWVSGFVLLVCGFTYVTALLWS